MAHVPVQGTSRAAPAQHGGRGLRGQPRRSAAEQALLNRVDYTIDRLVAEFNEDVAIFETLEQELRSYMAQHRKRFELAEKRATEGAARTRAPGPGSQRGRGGINAAPRRA